MTSIPRDQSRDRRIEDPTNLWLVHPLGHALLPWAIRHRISANAVSVAGLCLGAGAALCFAHWNAVGFATLGLGLALAWLVADGLDGKIARATGTASPLGRMLDGLCDHGVFALIYVSLALTVGTLAGWGWALAAAAAHAVQSNLLEAERLRFHRRLRGDPGDGPLPSRTRMPLETLYNAVTAQFDRAAVQFDRALAASSNPQALGARYAERATPALRTLTLGSANMRIFVLWFACLTGDPHLFWWFEIGPLSIVAVVGLVLHRRAERALIQDHP